MIYLRPCYFVEFDEGGFDLCSVRSADTLLVLPMPVDDLAPDYFAILAQLHLPEHGLHLGRDEDAGVVGVEKGEDVVFGRFVGLSAFEPIGGILEGILGTDLVVNFALSCLELIPADLVVLRLIKLLEKGLHVFR